MEDSDPFDPQGKVSYLQARDPSILSWNRHGIDKVRHNLMNDFVSESTLSSVPSEKEDNHVKVYLRIKDGVDYKDLYTVEGETLICRIPEGSCSSRNNRSQSIIKKYQFSDIFGPDTGQHELFNQIIKHRILNFINGRNGTLLAYGASGSGKTFTIIGTAEQPGIIPRALEYLFRTLPLMHNKPMVKPLPSGKIIPLNKFHQETEEQNLQTILTNSFSERSIHIKTYRAMQQRLSSNSVATIEHSPTIINVYVSFAEIYNEFVYDLLQPPPQRGHQRPKLKIGGLQDHIYIKELKYVYVRSGLEAYQVLQYGLTNLQYGDTAVNMHSSRSHCIFNVQLVQGNDVENSLLSTFNFCDLAGSERLKKTMNVGDRLKESKNINHSLMVLGRCISIIRDGQNSGNKENKVPPFRDSKLTQLFQRELTGKEDIMMIININPSEDMFDESQHTLNFAGIAKEIVVEEHVTKILKPSRFSAGYPSDDMITYIQDDERDKELREIRNERANLVLELSELRQEQQETIHAERQHLKNLYGQLIDMKDAQINKLEMENKRLKKLEEKEQQKKWDVIVLSDDDDEESEVVSRLRTEVQNFKTKVYLLKEKIGTMNEDREKLEIELAEAKETLRDAHEDFGFILNENKQLRKNVKDLEEKLLTLEDENKYLKYELEDVRSMNRENTEMLENEKTVLVGFDVMPPLSERDVFMESNRLTSSNTQSFPDLRSDLSNSSIIKTENFRI